MKIGWQLRNIASILVTVACVLAENGPKENTNNEHFSLLSWVVCVPAKRFHQAIQYYSLRSPSLFLLLFITWSRKHLGSELPERWCPATLLYLSDVLYLYQLGRNAQVSLRVCAECADGHLLSKACASVYPSNNTRRMFRGKRDLEDERWIWRVVSLPTIQFN